MSPTISPEDPDYDLDDDPAEQGRFGERDRPLNDDERGAGLPDGYLDDAAHQSDR